MKRKAESNKIKIEQGDWINLLRRISGNDESLTILDLQNHHLGANKGSKVNELCDALMRNNTVLFLNLRSNQLFRYPDSIQYIGKLIQVNNTIISMDLSCNFISDLNLNTLSKYLEQNRAIQQIDLGNYSAGLEKLRSYEQRSTRAAVNLITLKRNQEEAQLEPVNSETKKPKLSLSEQFRHILRTPAIMSKFKAPFLVNAPQPTIKSESFKHPLNEDEIRRGAIGIRGNSDASENCNSLVRCFINYLITGYIRVAGKSRPNLNESTFDVKKQVVKTETGLWPITQAVEATVLRKGLNVRMSAPLYPSIERMNGKEIINLAKEVMDVDQEECRGIRCTYDKIKDILLAEANEKGGVIIGEIVLLRCAFYHDQPGHILAFYAVNIGDQKNVYFINPQSYNGITKQGDPVFKDLRDRFEFNSQVQDSLRIPGKNTFGDYCFYFIHSEIKINNSSLYKLVNDR